jgi:hypothetical protein
MFVVANNHLSESLQTRNYKIKQIAKATKGKSFLTPTGAPKKPFPAKKKVFCQETLTELSILAYK